MVEDNEYIWVEEEEGEVEAYWKKVLFFFAISVIVIITISIGGRKGFNFKIINEGGLEASIVKVKGLLRG